jgi:hypothetical protein
MDKARKVSIISAIVIAGFALSVGYHYWQGAYAGRAYPYNTFLFLPSAYSSDFTDVVREGASLDPYRQYGSAQYPLLVIVGYVFSLIPNHSYPIYLLLLGSLFFALSAALLWFDNWWTSVTHIFIIAFLSYPFLFAVDRGNFELLVSVCLLAFVFFFTRKHYLVSAVALSFAVALKFFPVVFLVLFLRERKYREAIASLVASAVLTLASLLLLKGGLAANAPYLLHGSNLLGDNYVQRGVSLLTLLKIISFESGLFQGIDPTRFLRYYVLGASLAGVLMCAYVWARERVLWKQTAVLTSAMLLLPHISADYRLLHVFVPLYLFVNCKTRSKLDALYLSLFGLLLIPKDYLYLSKVVSDVPGAHDVSIAVPANIVILVAMTLLVVISGLIRRAPAASADESAARQQEPSSEAISL